MIEHSDVQSPYSISEIKLSCDKKLLLMYYNVQGNQTQSQSIRTFYLNEKSEYIHYEDQFVKNYKNMRNLTLRQGKLFELKFNIASKSKLRNNFKQHIEVEVTNG